MLAPWLHAMGNGPDTNPPFTLYQEGQVQVWNEAQLLVYGGSWVTHASMLGDGQFVISHSPHAFIDGNGATVQNLRLQNSNVTLLSPLYIGHMLQLTHNSQMRLINHPLYLLPLATLLTETGSGVRGCGTAQVIRLGILQQSPDATLTHAPANFFVSPVSTCEVEAPATCTVQQDVLVTEILPVWFVGTASPPPRG